jgi:hypothetical protein
MVISDQDSSSRLFSGQQINFEVVPQSNKGMKSFHVHLIASNGNGSIQFLKKDYVIATQDRSRTPDYVIDLTTYTGNTVDLTGLAGGSTVAVTGQVVDPAWSRFRCTLPTNTVAGNPIHFINQGLVSITWTDNSVVPYDEGFGIIDAQHVILDFCCDGHEYGMVINGKGWQTSGLSTNVRLCGLKDLNAKSSGIKSKEGGLGAAAGVGLYEDMWFIHCYVETCANEGLYDMNFTQAFRQNENPQRWSTGARHRIVDFHVVRPGWDCSQTNCCPIGFIMHDCLFIGGGYRDSPSQDFAFSCGGISGEIYNIKCVQDTGMGAKFQVFPAGPLFVYNIQVINETETSPDTRKFSAYSSTAANENPSPDGFVNTANDVELTYAYCSFWAQDEYTRTVVAPATAGYTTMHYRNYRVLNCLGVIPAAVGTNRLWSDHANEDPLNEDIRGCTQRLAVDWQFADYANQDFSPQPTSPSLGGGVDLSSESWLSSVSDTIAYDIDGMIRNMNDQGPYSYKVLPPPGSIPIFRRVPRRRGRERERRLTL